MLHLLANADLHAPDARGRVHLVVGAGQVLHVAPAADGLPATGDLPCTTIDLDGRRVIPGLVDGHVHVTGGGGEGGPAARVPGLPLTAYTTAGVTSVVGLLGTDDTVRTTAELLARVNGLRQEGLGAWALTGGYHLPPTTLTGSVRGDLALVEPIVGVGEVAISDHRSSQPTYDDLLRVGADTHVGAMLGGKPGVVHLHVGDGPRGLDLLRRAIAESELPARLWHPTHVNRRAELLDEAAALAAAHDVTVDVTAFPVVEGDTAVPAARAVAALLDHGVPISRISVSSDAGGSLPQFDDAGRVVGLDVGAPGHLLRVLADLVTAGHGLDDVLPAFTSTPARVFGLPGRGALETGTRADLVVLSDDGTATDVMVSGIWHVRDGQPVVRGTFEKERP